MEIHKSYYYYESRKDDSGVEDAIRAEAADSSVGFWKIFDSLRNDGYEWNHKRVYRIYKNMTFNKCIPLRRRLPARVKNPLVTPEDHNITWSMDFVTDTVRSGRKFRMLNVIDDSDRVAGAQRVAPSMPAERAIRYLEEIIRENGKPNNIRCDNGPEFVSHIFQDWSP
jgi:putative transposase